MRTRWKFIYVIGLWHLLGISSSTGSDNLIIRKSASNDQMTTARQTNSRAPANVIISADPISPEQFGAKGDGVTDDSKALQMWVSKLRGGNASLRLSPAKNYLISGRLTITPSSNWTIDLNGSKITQVESDEPIFYFSGEGSSDWTITNGVLQFNEKQDTTNKNAVGIGFFTPTDSKGYGWYNFKVTKLTFINGFYLCRILSDSSEPRKKSFWACSFEDITVENGVSGGLCSNENEGNFGSPRIVFRRVYHFARDSKLPTIYLSKSHNVILEDVEINNGDRQNGLFFLACNQVTINSVRFETIDLTQANSALIRGSLSSITVNQLEIGSVHVTAPGNVSVLDILEGTATGATLNGSLNGFTFYPGSSTFNQQLYILSARGSNVRIQYNNINFTNWKGQMHLYNPDIEQKYKAQNYIAARQELLRFNGDLDANNRANNLKVGGLKSFIAPFDGNVSNLTLSLAEPSQQDTIFCTIFINDLPKKVKLAIKSNSDVGEIEVPPGDANSIEFRKGDKISVVVERGVQTKGKTIPCNLSLLLALK